jgi:hypothetical protein
VNIVTLVIKILGTIRYELIKRRGVLRWLEDLKYHAVLNCNLASHVTHCASETDMNRTFPHIVANQADISRKWSQGIVDVVYWASELLF